MLKKGFILSAYHQDHRSDLELHLWVESHGEVFHLIYRGEKAIFFILREDKALLEADQEVRDVNLKSWQGNPVCAVYSKSAEKAALARQKVEGAGARTFEADVRAIDRFLMERFICSQIEFQSSENRERVLYNPPIRPASHYRPNLRVLSLDIETSARGELYSIGLHCRGRGIDEQYVLMRGENQGEVDGFTLEYFPDQLSLLQRFLQLFSLWDCDLLVGWHVVGFDLKVLERCFLAEKLPFSLGRDGSKVILKEISNRSTVARINGRQVIDGPPSLRANFFKFSNYKLETVAREVLGAGKDIGSEGSGKVQEIERRFREDKKALAKYNILDCTLVLDIYQKLQLVELLIERSAITGKTLDRLNSSSAAFDHFYLPRLHRKGHVATNIPDLPENEKSAGGGLVFEPVPGMYDYIAVFDFKSLYPSIMRTFCIDPLALHAAHEMSSVVPPGTSQHFSTEHHILPSYLAELSQKRADAKDQNNMALDQSIKILMNSFYGVLGAKNCRFYHSELTRAITSTGQWVLQKAKSLVEEAGFTVIYGDTDSLFVQLSADDRFSLKEKTGFIVKTINKKLARLILKEFSLEKSYLELQFESFYEKIFFSPLRNEASIGAKKRYVAYRHDDQGKMQLIFKGMEFVRNDWTSMAKSFQLGLFQQLFRGEDPVEWIKKFLQDLKEHKYDDQLIYAKRLSKKPSEYQKNIPPHVKAALLLGEEGEQLREIDYLITSRGPIPARGKILDIDYQHYIDSQIKPIAAPILPFLGHNFDEIISGDQLQLFPL